MQHREQIAEPYPGPRPYHKNEHSIFFGREEETADLRDLCMAYQLVVLYAQSGAGKSSLVGAGLRPSLIARRMRVLPVVRVGGGTDRRQLSSSSNIFVANALASLLGHRAPEEQVLASALKAASSEHARARLVVFDQFEELFTSYPDRWRDREGFFKQLNDALREDHELRVLLVMREEHIAELDSFCETVPTNLRIRYRLERLKDAAAKDAIQKPCTMFGWSIDDYDASKLIANLRHIKIRLGDVVDEIEGEYVEPVYLQVVCRDVWNNRNGNADNRLAIPDNVEDIDRSLITYYESALKLASHNGRVRQGKIRNWIDRELITPRGTRSYVFQGEKRTEGLPNAALAALEGAHVVRSEPRSGESWFELTHDRLIAPIRRSNLAWKKRTRLWLWPLYGLILLSLCMCGSVYLPRMYLGHIKNRANESKLEADGLAAQAAAIEANTAKDLSRRTEPLTLPNWLAVANKYEASLKDYNQAKDTTRLAEVYEGAGQAYLHMHEYDKAKDAFINAAKSDKDKKDRLASDLIAQGQADYLGGHTKDAIVDYEQAQQIFEASVMADTTRETDLLRHLGEAELRYGNYEKAKTAFKNAADKVHRFEQAGELVEDVFGVGLSVSQQGHYSDGKAIYELMFSPQSSTKPVHIPPPARILREIGFDELHNNDYLHAKEHLDMSYDEARDSGDMEQESYSALTLAEFYLELHEVATGKLEHKNMVERSGAFLPEQVNLGLSLKYALEAEKEFRSRQDEVMRAAAVTYMARAHIGMAARASTSADRHHLLAEAAQELSDALKLEKGQRRIGEAFTTQAQGILWEAKEDSGEAMKAYEMSYCLYSSMKSVSIHKDEVGKSLLALGRQPIECTSDQAGYPES
jgi:tetratricopeptide (TPR) repeat protein